jgi:hypothetical protein
MATNINFNKSLGISKGSSITLASNPATPLLLDTYPNAAVAYSLRKLRTAYSGSAIRVRRSSDSTEQDIGFVGNVLDTASLLIFCGVGNGFVRTWYDQSGNGRDADQSTPANQAQIVSNGSLIIDAITLKPTTTWTTDRYTILGGVSPITRYLSIGVLNRTAISNVIAHIGVAGAIGGTNGQQTFLWQPTTGNVRSDMSSPINHGTNASLGSFITTSEKNASNLKTIYLNGNALPTTSTQAPSLTGTNMNAFGQNGTNFTTCQYQEYIYWNSDQSTNRVAIETLINDYYAIF